MVPMKNPDATMEESYHICDTSVDLEHDSMHGIMDAKYKPANSWKYVSMCTHLTFSEQMLYIHS